MASDADPPAKSTKSRKRSTPCDHADSQQQQHVTGRARVEQQQPLSREEASKELFSPLHTLSYLMSDEEILGMLHIVPGSPELAAPAIVKQPQHDGTSALLNLPLEIHQIILEHICTMKDLLRLRAVCRFYRQLVAKRAHHIDLSGASSSSPLTSMTLARSLLHFFPSVQTVDYSRATADETRTIACCVASWPLSTGLRAIHAAQTPLDLCGTMFLRHQDTLQVLSLDLTTVDAAAALLHVIFAPVTDSAAARDAPTWYALPNLRELTLRNRITPPVVTLDPIFSSLRPYFANSQLQSFTYDLSVTSGGGVMLLSESFMASLSTLPRLHKLKFVAAEFKLPIGLPPQKRTFGWSFLSTSVRVLELTSAASASTLAAKLALSEGDFLTIVGGCPGVALFRMPVLPSCLGCFSLRGIVDKRRVLSSFLNRPCAFPLSGRFMLTLGQSAPIDFSGV